MHLRLRMRPFLALALPAVTAGTRSRRESIARSSEAWSSGRFQFLRQPSAAIRAPVREGNPHRAAWGLLPRHAPFAQGIVFLARRDRSTRRIRLLSPYLRHKSRIAP